MLKILKNENLTKLKSSMTYEILLYIVIDEFLYRVSVVFKIINLTITPVCREY